MMRDAMESEGDANVLWGETKLWTRGSPRPEARPSPFVCVSVCTCVVCVCGEEPSAPFFSDELPPS